jgi:hypothetical protein
VFTNDGCIMLLHEDLFRGKIFLHTNIYICVFVWLICMQECERVCACVCVYVYVREYECVFIQD